MWYDSLVPSQRPTADLAAARAAVTHAQGVRRYHRYQSERGDTQREADIRVALDRLRAVMVPLRTQIGRFPYGPQTTAAETNRQDIRSASRDVQSERRKLHKMKQKETTTQ